MHALEGIDLGVIKAAKLTHGSNAGKQRTLLDDNPSKKNKKKGCGKAKEDKKGIGK